MVYIKRYITKLINKYKDKKKHREELIRIEKLIYKYLNNNYPINKNNTTFPNTIPKEITQAFNINGYRIFDNWIRHKLGWNKKYFIRYHMSFYDHEDYFELYRTTNFRKFPIHKCGIETLKQKQINLDSHTQMCSHYLIPYTNVPRPYIETLLE